MFRYTWLTDTEIFCLPFCLCMVKYGSGNLLFYREKAKRNPSTSRMLRYGDGDSATPIDDQYNRMRPRESQGITNLRGLLHNVSERKPC